MRERERARREERRKDGDSERECGSILCSSATRYNHTRWEKRRYVFSLSLSLSLSLAARSKRTNQLLNHDAPPGEKE